MAENKKSFILYCDLIHLVNKLPDDKAGLLFKHLLSYVNDENPLTEDLLVEIAFESIKRQLKRDLAAYKERIDGKSESGKIGNLKRWHPDLYDLYIKEIKTLNECLFIAEGRKVSHTDKVRSHPIAKIADTVNDTVNVINNISIDFDKLLFIFNEKFGRAVRVIPKKAKKQILDRLKEGYTKTDFVNALENAKNDQYHKDSNYKYITLEFISRPDKFERYSSNHNFKVKTKIL